MNIDIKNMTQEQLDDLNLAENLRKVKSGEIKKCRNCEYSQVVSSDGEEYEGTTDCQGNYINSHSMCNTGNYKYKFEDDWSKDE